MNEEFIFCPFCGASEWIAQKFKGSEKGRIASYECYHCGDFTYKSVSVTVNHPEFTSMKVTQSLLCLIEARVAPYIVTINYVDKTTIFEEIKGKKEILNLDQVMDFDWYKGKAPLLEKIKTYVVFS